MVEIIKSPSWYSPVDNPIIWGFRSSGNTTCIFEVSVLKPITYEVIYTARIVPPPSTPNVGYINLSPILASLVNYDVKDIQNTPIPKPNNYFDYILQIREYVNINGELRFKNPVLDSDYGIYFNGTISFFTPVYMAYQAKFDVNKYTEFGDYDYICSYSTTGKFLTNKPQNEKINFQSKVSLYFMIGDDEFDLFASEVRLKYIINGTTEVMDPDFILPYTTTTCLQASTEIVIDDYIPQTGFSHSVRLISTVPSWSSQYIFFGGVTGNTVQQYVVNLTNSINSYAYNYGFTATTGSSNSIILSTCGTQLNVGCDGQCMGGFLNGQFISIQIPYSGYSKYWYNVITTGTYQSGITYSRMYQLWWDPRMWCSGGVLGTLQKGDTIELCLASEDGTTEYSERYKFIWDESDTNCVQSDLECNRDLVNIHFTNSLGGVDILQGINPSISYNVENKTYINNVFDITKSKHNEYKGKLELNSNSSPIGRDGERPYLKDKISYDKQTKATLTVYTKFLTDEESKWLMELFRSQSVWIEGDEYPGDSYYGYSSELIPLILKNNQSEVKRKKFIKDQFIQYELTFEIPQQYINVLSQIIRREPGTQN